MIAPLARTQLVTAARRMHAAGWVANHDGNASVRVGKDRFLITPTATSKAEVTESSLVLVDGAGAVIEGTRRPPGELELHLAAYRARPDVQAVLHAHPPTATAFGVAGVPLELPLPEAVVSLGRVTLQPLALPKSPQATEAVARGVTEGEALLLAGNGALTVGPDLSLCFLRMELVEHLAKIVHLARALGGVQPLPEEAQKQLLAAHRKAFPRP
jgi:L-fuculose-phosphate aldolase